MAKKLQTVALNPVGIDNYGLLIPLNGTTYKNEAALEKALSDGSLSIPETLAGIVVLEVKNLVDVKEAAPKGGKDKTPTPPPVAPLGEGTNPKA